MGKIAPVSAKYIIHAQINVEGVADRPDVIGSIFGQTEGLLGSDLELRELQRSGRIGRIEVELDTKSGKTVGSILIPSSLDQTETVLIASSLETIQRIGPCNANVNVGKVEDVRISKRNQVITRAKELLNELKNTVLPDSQDIKEEVAHAVRMMDITEYGRDRLPAGPGIDEAEEITLVEGRADVLTLLKSGFKNVIALNGTSVPKTIVDLCRKKVVTAFVDGDHGGDLIIKELMLVTEIDYVAKAPDGKEVEELTKKELHKAIRSKITAEQAKLEMNGTRKSNSRDTRDLSSRKRPSLNHPPRHMNSPRPGQRRQVLLPKIDAEKYKKMLDDLMGTRGAYVLDESANILGKVPTTELNTTMKSLGSGVHAVILDGKVTSDLVSSAEQSNVKCVVGMEMGVNPRDTRIKVLTGKDL